MFKAFDAVLGVDIGGRITLEKELVQFRCAQFRSLFLPEGVITALAERLPYTVYHFAKRAFTGAVANKALVVFYFDIVTVNIDGTNRREPCRAMVGMVDVSVIQLLRCVWKGGILRPMDYSGYQNSTICSRFATPI